MKDYDELLKEHKLLVKNTYSKNLEKLQKEIETSVIEQGNNIVFVYMNDVRKMLNELDIEYIMLEELNDRAKFIVFPTEKQKKILKIEKTLLSIFLILFCLEIIMAIILGIGNVIFLIGLIVCAFYGFTLYTQVDFEKILKKYAIPLDKSNKKC